MEKAETKKLNRKLKELSEKKETQNSSLNLTEKNSTIEAFGEHNTRLYAKMPNGEEVLVSRKYAAKLKETIS